MPDPSAPASAQPPSAAAPASGNGASLPWLDPHEATTATLRQCEWLLKGEEDALRVHLDTTHLALERTRDWLRRAGNEHGNGRSGSPSGAEGIGQPLDPLALQTELGRFATAASVRHLQALGDVWAQMWSAPLAMWAGAAGHVLDALPALPRPDPTAWMPWIHTGVRPLDDLFSASLNRDLVPPSASRPVDRGA